MSSSVGASTSDTTLASDNVQSWDWFTKLDHPKEKHIHNIVISSPTNAFSHAYIYLSDEEMTIIMNETIHPCVVLSLRDPLNLSLDIGYEFNTVACWKLWSGLTYRGLYDLFSYDISHLMYIACKINKGYEIADYAISRGSSEVINDKRLSQGTVMKLQIKYDMKGDFMKANYQVGQAMIKHAVIHGKDWVVNLCLDGDLDTLLVGLDTAISVKNMRYIETIKNALDQKQIGYSLSQATNVAVGTGDPTLLSYVISLGICDFSNNIATICQLYDRTKLVSHHPNYVTNEDVEIIANTVVANLPDDQNLRSFNLWTSVEGQYVDLVSKLAPGTELPLMEKIVQYCYNPIFNEKIANILIEKCTGPEECKQVLRNHHNFLVTFITVETMKHTGVYFDEYLYDAWKGVMKAGEITSTLKDLIDLVSYEQVDRIRVIRERLIELETRELGIYYSKLQHIQWKKEKIEELQAKDNPDIELIEQIQLSLIDYSFSTILVKKMPNTNTITNKIKSKILGL